MQNLLVTDQSFDYSRDIMREQLLELFDASGRGEIAEKRMEARVSQMIRGFLREVDFSSAIDIRHLIERFSDSRIPVEPYDAQEYLELLDDNVVAHSTRTASPRFIGHMTSALPLFVRPLARLMAALNQNVVKAETAKALTPYERQALAMIHRLIFRMPDEFYAEHGQSKESTLGMIVSGGTIANITALWCARNASLAPRDGRE
jgi:glutamate/tyrosine decarboxylase-like PLP-dependent enzyme